MSKKCRVLHDWSKQHLVETLTNQLLQISICTTCGQFDTGGVNLTAIKRSDITGLWELYHGEALTAKVQTKKLPVETAPAFNLTESTQKWTMPDWMVPYCGGFLPSKSDTEEMMTLGNEYVRGQVEMLLEIQSKGMLSHVGLVQG